MGLAPGLAPVGIAGSHALLMVPLAFVVNTAVATNMSPNCGLDQAAQSLEPMGTRATLRPMTCKLGMRQRP